MATQPLSDRMRAFFAHVDAHEEEFVNRLRECVAIPGVSAEPARRPDVIRTMHWTKEWLDRLGAETRLVDIGTQPLPDGSSIPLPPVLLAQFGTNPDNNTVCVYGHLDVQPAAKEDGWDTEPFELTEVDGALFGRGSTDDKGPVLGTLCALQSFLELDLDVLSRLNVKLLLEGMEESGSVGIPELIEREARPGGFLSDVSCFLISDNYWLGRSKPCLTYGLRGMAYFWLTVEGGARDLHSGVFGGTVFEPMTDLVKLMGTLVDTQGRIQVAGIMDDVAPLTEEERRRYHGIDFDLESFKSDAGVAGRVLHEDTSALLMHRWRFPTLSLHGIEGAFAGAGCKTVLPRKVIGKFSIRLVPDMAPERVLALVEAHLRAEFEKLGSGNRMEVKLAHAAPAWLGDPDHPNFVAARRAIEQVYGVQPDLTREGGSIPIALEFERHTGRSVTLLPVGRSDDGAHSQNEKLDRVNYVNGIKVLGCYLDHIADAAL